MSVDIVGDGSSVLSLIGENYRSDHETSDSESDSTVSVISFSTTSSESEESSSSEAEGDDDKEKDKEETTEVEAEEKVKKKKKVKEIPKLKGELTLDDLPRIEDLHISVPHESTRPIGFVKSFVVPLVVIEGLPNLPALNIDTVLFLEKGDRALGHIFEIFGPVKQPYYCVRFNSRDHIDEKGIKVGMKVYCAPSTPHTIYVLVAQLQQNKGTDASWTDDYERPDEEQDFSDDEKERVSRKHGPRTTNGTNTATTTTTTTPIGPIFMSTNEQDRQVMRARRRGKGRGRGGPSQMVQNPNNHYLNGWSYAPVHDSGGLVPFPVPIHQHQHQHQSRPNPNLNRPHSHGHGPQRPPYIPTLLVPGFYPPRRYPFQGQYFSHSTGRMELIHSQQISRFEGPRQSQRPIYSQAHLNLPHRLAILPPPPPPPPKTIVQGHDHGQSQKIIPAIANQHNTSTTIPTDTTPTPAQFMQMFQNFYPALYQEQQQAFLNNCPNSNSNPNPSTATPIQFPKPNTNSTLTQNQLPLNPNQSSTPPPPGV